MDVVKTAAIDQRSTVVMAAISIGPAIAIRQPTSAGEPVGKQVFNAKGRAVCPDGSAPARVAHRGATAPISTSAAPTTVHNWLRQSLMMNTTGSSSIWPRRANIQMRSSM